MKMTVTIDDVLYEKALAAAAPAMECADLFWEALKIFVRVQTAKCRAALGAAANDMQLVPR